MNVFSYELATAEIESAPDLDARKFVIDDNIGESIHIHYRNVRFEFSVEDFVRFAEACESASEGLENGDR